MSACPSYETLVALWAGELNDAEAAAVDEHLFGCDACAAATERLAKVVGTLREKLPFVISHAHRERLEAAGTRIAVTDVEPTLDPTLRPSARFTPNVDLLVFALRGDVSSADRVDVEIASPTGEPRLVRKDGGTHATQRHASEARCRHPSWSTPLRSSAGHSGRPRGSR
jgi:anti-sigma factor RsiW